MPPQSACGPFVDGSHKEADEVPRTRFHAQRSKLKNYTLSKR